MLEEFYKEQDVSVHWDSGNNWVFSDWRNVPSEETVQRGCGEILKLLKSRKASKVLNSNAKVTGPWSAASYWVAEVWFPQMVQAGLKQFAWIQSPASISSQISAKSSKKKDDSDVIQLFDDERSAVSWLKSR
jgi:hypothetical protein